MVRIASWNINSIRIREDLIRRFCDHTDPDILCLQETKVDDAAFPLQTMQRLGFEYVYYSGQKSYHGVAVLSKRPLEHLHNGQFIDKDEKRHMAVRLPGNIVLHNFYIPAGGDIPDPGQNPKFKDKLDFVDAMARWSAQTITPEDRVIILGDFNIAPQEHDVWSHKQLLKVVSHTPMEVERLTALQEASQWVDVMRHFVPASEKLYSWWSYRNRDWARSDRGRRLDHIWVTPALLPQLQSGTITREARGWDSPSDHVPVTMALNIVD